MINILKGMKDIYDDEAKLYEYIIKTCEKIAKNYSFDLILTPHLELNKLFHRSVGASSDIVGKEMYEFVDKGDNVVCLRPEGTAGIVRAYIEHKFDKQQIAKRWYYHGSMFRYERPQKARFREFHQFGVESFGIKSVLEDASLILMVDNILKELNIKAKLKINSLGCVNCIKIFNESFLNFIKNKDGFCIDCNRRKNLNPLRMLDCKQDFCQVLLKDAPRLDGYLCDECKIDFDSLKNILNENLIEFEIDNSLVRGLDYYSKTTFEFQSDELGAQSAIAGGGRYDRLISYLDGKDGYGVGFAIGIERIMAILSQRKNTDLKRDGIYLCSLDEKYLGFLLQIATKLRANGEKVFFSYDIKKPIWHLSNADAKNAQFFACIGEDEINNKNINIKILGQDKTKSEKQEYIKNNIEKFLK